MNIPWYKVTKKSERVLKWYYDQILPLKLAFLDVSYIEFYEIIKTLFTVCKYLH